MNEYEPITEEGIKEAARLLHERNPSIPYNQYLGFLSRFVGHDMTEEEFTSEIQNFELQEEVDQTLLEDVEKGKLEMTVNEKGEIVFYKPKKKGKKKR